MLGPPACRDGQPRRRQPKAGVIRRRKSNADGKRSPADGGMKIRCQNVKLFLCEPEATSSSATDAGFTIEDRLTTKQNGGIESDKSPLRRPKFA